MLEGDAVDYIVMYTYMLYMDKKDNKAKRNLRKTKKPKQNLECEQVGLIAMQIYPSPAY